MTVKLNIFNISIIFIIVKTVKTLLTCSHDWNSVRFRTRYEPSWPGLNYSFVSMGPVSLNQAWLHNLIFQLSSQGCGGTSWTSDSWASVWLSSSKCSARDKVCYVRLPCIFWHGHVSSLHYAIKTIQQSKSLSSFSHASRTLRGTT